MLLLGRARVRRCRSTARINPDEAAPHDRSEF